MLKFFNMKKRKLLVNAVSVQAGGAKKRLLAFMDYIDRDDRFEVVLLKRYSLDTSLENIKVISLPSLCTPFFRLVSDFFLVPLLYLFGYKKAYIFGNFFLSCYFGQIIWNLTNIEPFVCDEFGVTYEGWQKWRLLLLRCLFKISCKPDILVAQSICTAELLREKTKCQVVHVYNGVDIKLNNQLSFSPHVKNDGIYNVLFLGQIVRYKRLFELIYYLSVFGLFKKIMLSVVGSTMWDKGYFCEICNLIKNLEVDEYVSFCGEKSHDESMNKLRSSDALIYTNAYDNCPNVVLEAMSFNIPVLAIENEVVKELNDRFGGVSFFDFQTDPQDFLNMFKVTSVSNFKYSWDDHCAEITNKIIEL